MRTALLLDLGGTAFASPLELMGVLAEREPAARAVLARRGPLGTEPDEAFDRVRRGELTELAYLRDRAAEVLGALGRDGGLPAFMRALLTLPGVEPLRPEAVALIADARARGIAVGVLTNDLAALGGSAARARYPFLAELDALVDGSVTGVLKPDPLAYRMAADALGHPPAATVFLDDLPANVAGAAAAGMAAIPVDIAAPGAAFAAARAELGLP